MELTSEFPSDISFLMRLKAIASQNHCECVWCGKVHGSVKIKYCSHECYVIDKKSNAVPLDEARHRLRVIKSEEKFKNKTEGLDYLVCQICNVKSGDLGSHVHMHGITPAEYKEKFNLTVLKPQRNRDNRKGKNNPAYQHGGKYSPWSEKFIHGYDAERHKKRNIKHSEFIRENKHLFKNNLEYWLVEANGNVEKANEMYRKFQVRDLSYFVEKYGEEEGKKRHALKTERWQDTLNSKSIEELSDINSRKVRKSYSFSSAPENELFNELIKYFQVTQQLCLCRDETAKRKKFYLYDISVGNKIIEFNGDFWHANPEVYTESFVLPYSGLSASEIHKRDKDKINLAISRGYDVLVVWEKDFKENKEKVIQECINFLNQ